MGNQSWGPLESPPELAVAVFFAGRIIEINADFPAMFEITGGKQLANKWINMIVYIYILSILYIYILL